MRVVRRLIAAEDCKLWSIQRATVRAILTTIREKIIKGKIELLGNVSIGEQTLKSKLSNGEWLLTWTAPVESLVVVVVVVVDIAVDGVAVTGVALLSSTLSILYDSVEALCDLSSSENVRSWSYAG